MEGVGPSTRNRTTKSGTAFKQPARVKPSNKPANAPLQSTLADTPDEQVLSDTDATDSSPKDVYILAKLQSVVEQSGDSDGLITSTIKALSRKDVTIKKLTTELQQRQRFYTKHMEAVRASKTELDQHFAEVQKNYEALKEENENLKDQNELFDAQILESNEEILAQDEKLGNLQNENEDLVSQNNEQKRRVEQLQMKIETLNRLLSKCQQELLKVNSSSQSSLSTKDPISKSKSKSNSDRRSSKKQNTIKNQKLSKPVESSSHPREEINAEATTVNVEEAIPEVNDPSPQKPNAPGPSVDLPDDQQPGPSRKMKMPSAIPRYVGRSKPTSNDSIAEDQSKPGKVKKAKSMPSLRNLKRGEPKEYKTEYSAMRGAQSENYETLRKYASSSDSEPGEEFVYKDIRLKKRDPPRVEENELAWARYRNRPLKIKAEIDRLEVAMFYHDLALYKEVNENILRLYKVSSPYTCGLCSHLGLKKVKQAVAVGFEEFTDHSHYIAHFWRFHYRRVECTVCGFKTETARLMSGHQGSMLRAPNEAHRKHQEEERKKRQAEGKQNPAPAGGKKAAPKLKPKKYVTKAAPVDKSSSDDESAGTDSDDGESVPTRVTRQASKEGQEEKEKVTKRKVSKPSKKPIDKDKDSDDGEYDKADKKRPKKKKKQDE